MQNEIQSYINEVELIEQIFERLEEFRSNDEKSLEEKTLLYNDIYKEQLMFEIDWFKHNIEGDLIKILNKFYDEKSIRSEIINKKN